MRKYALVSMIGLNSCVNSPVPLPAFQEDISTEDIPIPSADLQEDEEEEIEEDPNAEVVTQDFVFDDTESLLYIQVWKDESSLASGMAHNHVIRATNWTGSARYNKEDIDVCALEFSLDVDDLSVDEDAMREYVGYDDTISTNDRETIKGHMLSEGQLNGEAHSSITFESSKCEIRNDEQVTVTGTMFIAGSSKTMAVDMNLSQRNNKLYLSGAIDFTHADFNITPYSFLGLVSNREELKITFDMLGRIL